MNTTTALARSRNGLAALSAAVCSTAWLPATAADTAPSAPTPQAVATSLEGRLIVAGMTFYRIARVESIDDAEGSGTLHAEGDPLFPVEYLKPETNENGRISYEVGPPDDAKCGVTGMGTRIDTRDFAVFHQGRFVPPAEAFGGDSFRSPDMPSGRVTPAVLQKLEACGKKLAKIGDAMPFRRIGLYAHGQLVTEVARTLSSSAFFEEFPGDDEIAKMSHVAITPKDGRSLDDFEVEVRLVSVMHCDYEGPHIELDEWKHGESPAMRLKRSEDRFVIGVDVLAAPMPAFPAYTETELRQAVARHFGEDGLATEAEYTPCAPYLRGYEFTVRYRARPVQEIFVANAGGC
jgi:hypothetical protein